MISICRLLFFSIMVSMSIGIKYPSCPSNGSCENDVQRFDQIINDAKTASNGFINDIIANDDIMPLYILSITKPTESVRLLQMTDQETMMKLGRFVLKKMGILDMMVKYDMAETDTRTYINISWSFRDETPGRQLRKLFNHKDLSESFTWTL